MIFEGLATKILAIAMGFSLNIDFGGDLISRMQTFEMLENTQVTIPLEGVCISACTMFLGLSKVCVQPGMIFGFHSAYTIDEKGQPEKSAFGNSVMMHFYPDNVQKWAKETKALENLDLTYMNSETAWKLGIPKCSKGK